MEQATNLFNKGLQMDTHPMVQSNDSLTDCLNGTLITMNGNEVILQNDMGNRRVNNAFLPPGYQPVGMKEYGGIIYIAAYNPITNQSLIGSFPSPLRKFNDIDSDGDLDLDKFFEKGNIFYEQFTLKNLTLILPFVKSDTLFVPLTGDSAIYPGDKFIVYCSNLKDRWEELTNYNNINGDKIITPKNKDYTLYLGVLNSLNEFMDITPTLQRWNNNKIINFREEYDYDVSDKFKFNSGYFIPSSFSNNELKETIADAEFIRARQALPINTYSSKLIGPLYLKAQFNHVLDFEYSITGYQYIDKDTGELYVSLTIDGFFTYNCLDLNLEENTAELTPNQWIITKKEDGTFIGSFGGEQTTMIDGGSEVSSGNSSELPVPNPNPNPISGNTGQQGSGEQENNNSSENNSGYSNFENDDVNNPFSVVKNPTDDTFIYDFNYTDVIRRYEVKDNNGKQYIVVGWSAPVKVIVTQNEENWTVPYNYTKDGDLVLYIPSKSVITILADSSYYYIDTVEIEGQVQNLELYTKYGEQRGNTWNAQTLTPRQVQFTCDFAYITHVKVKARDIEIRNQEIEDLHLDYSIPTHINGISDFIFSMAENITFYNPLEYIGQDFVENTMYYGSATLTFNSNEHINFLRLSSEYKLMVYPGTEFTIEVPSKYAILIIELYGDAEIECLSPIGTFKNNIWDNRGSSQEITSVTFRCKGNYPGYLDEVLVRHSGLSGIPYNAAIRRTFTNYKILEQLLRKGSSVSTGEAKKLTIISEKINNVFGFAPNETQRTVEIVCDDLIIAYGHFEEYELTQDDLDRIDDGYTREYEDYYAIRLVYDAYNENYNELINIKKQFTFNVKQDAFGDFHFREYLLDYEIPEFVKAEDCTSNQAFNFTVNIY